MKPGTGRLSHVGAPPTLMVHRSMLMTTVLKLVDAPQKLVDAPQKLVDAWEQGKALPDEPRRGPPRSGLRSC